jgi:ATP-binding cassette subfamily C (CFTR/MRP) protein 1
VAAAAAGNVVSTLSRILEITNDSSTMIDGVGITTTPRQLVRERLNAIPQEAFFLAPEMSE